MFTTYSGVPNLQHRFFPPLKSRISRSNRWSHLPQKPPPPSSHRPVVAALALALSPAKNRKNPVPGLWFVFSFPSLSMYECGITAIPYIVSFFSPLLLLTNSTSFNQTIPRSPTIRNSDSSKGKAPAAPPVDDDSATEESDEGDTVPGQVNLEKRDTVMRSPSPPNVPTGAGPSTGSRAPAASARADDSDSDLDAAPKRPVAPKKKRAASTSSDDSSDARPSGPAVKRGARQPVKRGGKRF